MPSKSYAKFIKNMESVTRLESTYELLRSQRNGRGRAAWDHVTRSAIIFLASSFEVYIEDVLVEAVSKHIKYSSDAKNLPNNVKNTLNKYVRKEANSVPPTDLCDEGWRSVYKEITNLRTGKLNTPKKENIIRLFEELVGNVDIITNVNDIDLLDDIISFRGEIAHRVRAQQYVTIIQATESRLAIQKIAMGIDRNLLHYLRDTYPNQRMDWYDSY